MAYRTNDVQSKLRDRANGTRANCQRENGNRADVVAPKKTGQGAYILPCITMNFHPTKNNI